MRRPCFRSGRRRWAAVVVKISILSRRRFGSGGRCCRAPLFLPLACLSWTTATRSSAILGSNRQHSAKCAGSLYTLHVVMVRDNNIMDEDGVLVPMNDDVGHQRPALIETSIGSEVSE